MVFWGDVIDEKLISCKLNCSFYVFFFLFFYFIIIRMRLRPWRNSYINHYLNQVTHSASLPTDLHLDTVGGLFTKRDPATDRHRHRVHMASGCLAPSPCGDGAVGQQGSWIAGQLVRWGGGPRSPTRNIPSRRGSRSPLGGGATWMTMGGGPEYGARGPMIHYGRGTRPLDTEWEGYPG